MINQLTVLRFVFAFIVFLFHLNTNLGFKLGIGIIDKFLSHRAVFMSGFFVLSGYTMCHIYSKSDFMYLKNF
jgi:peptidoglycan/LPS O-acetylase OafA/YrhL